MYPEVTLCIDYMNIELAREQTITHLHVLYLCRNRYSAYSFCMGEHGGTHLDAPIHFNVNGWTVDQIPLTNLIDVPAVLIDVEDEVNAMELSHDFVFDVNHIENFEKSHGIIPSGSAVLVHTGWSKYWPNKVNYLGWNNYTETLNFPGCVTGTIICRRDES